VGEKCGGRDDRGGRGAASTACEYSVVAAARECHVSNDSRRLGICAEVLSCRARPPNPSRKAHRCVTSIWNDVTHGATAPTGAIPLRSRGNMRASEPPKGVGRCEPCGRLTRAQDLVAR
jgi:hypothetical protein